MAYIVELSIKAQKQLKAFPEQIQNRLKVEIDALATNPRPSGVVALQGTKGLLRLRVGDYRVIYQVEDDRLVIFVVQVGHRREVYRGL